MLAFRQREDQADQHLRLHAQSRGRVGEYFAAYVLESNGIEAHRVDVHHSDLWCRIDETLVMVEVKSVSAPKAYGSNVSLKYHFNVGANKQGWFCFVALDRQLLLLRPVSEFRGKRSLALLPEEFNAENQRRTIEEFKESC